MQKMLVVCDECGRRIVKNEHFRITYKGLQAKGINEVEDLCNVGCLTRRLSRVLPHLDSFTVVKVVAEDYQRIPIQPLQEVLMPDNGSRSEAESVLS